MPTKPGLTNSGDAAKRRWYDQRSELNECIGLLESFPEEIYAIICDGANCMIENELGAHQMLSSLKSLGSEKVLGIYKSKNKRRKMDREPHFHKMMNYFFILSPQNRLFMAGLIKDLVMYIRNYVEVCRVYRQPVSLEDVTGITRCYVDKGGEEAQVFLESLQEHFQRQVQNILTNSHSEGEILAIEEDETGLHLRPRQ